MAPALLIRGASAQRKDAFLECETVALCDPAQELRSFAFCRAARPRLESSINMRWHTTESSGGGANGISNGCGLLLLHGIKKAIFMPPVHLKSSPPSPPAASIRAAGSSKRSSAAQRERDELFPLPLLP